MRVMFVILSLLVLATPASAQSTPGSCAPVGSGRVDVVTSSGTLRGTLFCLDADDVTLLRDGELVRTPLTSVRRIVKPADPIWDGAVKGAAGVLTIWGIACGFCGAGDIYPWRAVAGYAVLGATIDALQTNTRTIYSGGGRSASLQWRVRF